MAIKFRLLFMAMCVTNTFAHLTAPENRKVIGASVSSPKTADLALHNKSDHNLHRIVGGSSESNVYNSGHGGPGRSNGFQGRRGSRRRGSNKHGGSRKRFTSRWRWWSFL